MKILVIVVILIVVTTIRNVEGDCADLTWTKLPEKGLALNVSAVFDNDVEVESYCKPKCADDPNCVTFDVVDVGEYNNCRFSGEYGPINDIEGFDHWERRRWCTSLTGRNCSFLYVGEYYMSESTSLTLVSADNGNECLEKCADSNTCKVASYLDSECQHSPNEQSAIDGRMRDTGWSQYKKVNCDPETNSKANPTVAKTPTNTTSPPSSSPPINTPTQVDPNPPTTTQKPTATTSSNINIFIIPTLMSGELQPSSRDICTINEWKIIKGKRLVNGAKLLFYYDKDPTIFCTRKCLFDKDCVTFDSSILGTRPVCYLYSSYEPLMAQKDSWHWEYRRSCVTKTGATCSFLYIGQFAMTVTSTFTKVTAINGEDCLKKCVESKTCKVVSYQDKNCQHSPDEAKALSGRTNQIGWSQYKRDKCTGTKSAIADVESEVDLA